LHILKKRDYIPKGSNSNEPKSLHLFADTVFSFFRRPCWSPEGQLLFTPCGVYFEEHENKQVMHYTTYVFARHSLSKPILHFPTPGNQPSVAVRCNPVLFKNQDSGSKLFDIAYRIVFAIATTDSVCVYHTQSIHLIAISRHFHKLALTDLTWSQDGYALGISSSDGYCSFMTFTKKDLGEPLESQELKLAMADVEASRTRLSPALANITNVTTKDTIISLKTDTKTQELADTTTPSPTETCYMEMENTTNNPTCVGAVGQQ